MVKLRRVLPHFSFLSVVLIPLLLGSTIVRAETSLNVSVDRNQLYETEVLNLTVQANTAVDFSLGGLMNFGGAQIESPKFEGLEDHWEVLDKQQSYNMQSINGSTQSTITWRYALAPRNTGQLIIPPASFKDATSEAGYVEVLAGSRPRDEANPPVVFVQAEVDKASPYLQEQIIYRLKLFTLGEARGDMSAPSHPDFIIEEMGETAKRYEMAYNRRYEVYERRYLLFPQKSGALTIDAQQFTGTVQDNRTRRRVRAREVSNRVTVDVKAPPANYTGDVWLPASSLFLDETWGADNNSIIQGDSVTRELTLSSLGVLGSALPELSRPKLAGLKVYPDQPSIDSVEHQQGVQSTRTEVQALVAVTPGTYTLPEVSLTWWDTINDKERVATLPAREITVVAAAPSVSDASNSPSAAEAVSSPTHTDPLTPNDESQSERASENLIANSLEAKTAAPESIVSDRTWLAIIALIILAWGANVLWLISRKNRASDGQASVTAASDAPKLSALTGAIKHNSAELSPLLLAWINSHSIARYTSISDATGEHDELVSAYRVLEALRYSAHNEANEGDLKAATDTMLGYVKSNNAKSGAGKTGKKNTAHSLKPFYPA